MAMKVTNGKVYLSRQPCIICITMREARVGRAGGKLKFVYYIYQMDSEKLC